MEKLRIQNHGTNSIKMVYIALEHYFNFSMEIDSSVIKELMGVLMNFLLAA